MKQIKEGPSVMNRLFFYMYIIMIIAGNIIMILLGLGCCQFDDGILDDRPSFSGGTIKADSTWYKGVVATSIYTPINTITIGSYKIAIDSLVSLTPCELDSVTSVIRFVTIPGLWLPSEVTDKLCERMLPVKLRRKE